MDLCGRNVVEPFTAPVDNWGFSIADRRPTSHQGPTTRCIDLRHAIGMNKRSVCDGQTAVTDRPTEQKSTIDGTSLFHSVFSDYP
jgi:hypothetical protein